ncbi:uncharacterized protein LOC144297398 [Canis aureus]
MDSLKDRWDLRGHLVLLRKKAPRVKMACQVSEPGKEPRKVQVGAIMNNTSRNIYFCLCVDMSSFLLDRFLRVKLLGRRTTAVSNDLIFYNTHKRFEMNRRVLGIAYLLTKARDPVGKHPPCGNGDYPVKP